MTINMRSIQVCWWVVCMVRVAMAARYDDEYNYNGDYNKEFLVG